MADDFLLPDLGEGIHEAQIIQVLVKEGEVVEADQPIMEVETDKAAVEIPSPQAGEVSKVYVSAGDTVNVGAPLLSFGSNGQSAAAPAAPSKPAERTEQSKAEKAAPSAPAAPSQSPAKSGKPAKIAASPAVRRLAKENNVDLATIAGSGPGGRITRDDLEAVLKGGAPRAAAPAASGSTTSAPAASPAMPSADLPDFGKWGPVRREKISQIRKTISNQMVRSEALNVHVTHHDMADVEMLEKLRKDHNERRRENDPKLTMLPFIMKAVHAGMRQFPQFNASFDHDSNEVIYKDYFHFGVAVDTPRGLVVPVIRDVDKKSIRELAQELTELGERTRSGSFSIDELRGGSFTITNIGSLGGIVSTPIINYPEVAILGLGRAQMKPVVADGKVVARYMLPMNLSFDHRVIDGADAARFTSEVMRYLEVPGRLLLED